MLVSLKRGTYERDALSRSIRKKNYFNDVDRIFVMAKREQVSNTSFLFMVLEILIRRLTAF